MVKEVSVYEEPPRCLSLEGAQQMGFPSSSSTRLMQCGAG